MADTKLPADRTYSRDTLTNLITIYRAEQDPGEIGEIGKELQRRLQSLRDIAAASTDHRLTDELDGTNNAGYRGYAYPATSKP